jgi:hypothetical protein
MKIVTHISNARALFAAPAAAVLLAALVTPLDAPAAPPAAGDAYVYAHVNGYSREVLGHLRYRVDKTDASSITLSVTPDHPAAWVPRTEIRTREGNWLLHPVENHGWKVDYLFATAYPAYVFPLDPGRSWSVRVNATAHGDPRTRSVRVDGKVMGPERIRVPAGEFDAVKIERVVYPGDANPGQTETHIIETDWYAPALGRPVRTERKSQWQEPSRCGRFMGCDFRGDWDVFELIEVRAARN